MDKFKELACTIMIPSAIIDRVTAEGEIKFKRTNLNLSSYVEKVTDLAFRDPRSYDEFREFIGDYRFCIGDPHYNRLKRLTDREIDRVIDKIQEEKINFFRQRYLVSE